MKSPYSFLSDHKYWMSEMDLFGSSCILGLEDGSAGELADVIADPV